MGPEIRGAEEHRATLQAIFNGAMRAAAGVSPRREDDVRFHLYDALASLVRKLQGAIGRPLHQLWAAAEELRFLFDAHAVWLRVPEEKRTGTDRIWEIATLTNDEKTLFQPVWDATFEGGERRRETSRMRWDVFDPPFGGRQPAPKNSNLASVNGVLVIDVPGDSGRLGWQLAVFMEHSLAGRQTPRESTRVCEAIFSADIGGTEPHPIVGMLNSMRVPFGATAVTDTTDSAYWPLDRRGFQREVQVPRAGPPDFNALYQERYRPIHVILDLIYNQMDALLAAERQLKGAETTILFSYRAPDEDFVCFFPTPGQAASFVRTPGDIDDFLYFWQFQYRSGEAISGWVMATGTSDYTERFDEDGRWTEWLDNAPQADKPRIARQLALVRRFFRTEAGHEKKFMYLVPIVLLRSRQLSQLQPILVASVGSSTPLAAPLRKQLFDLAWQIAPAVEMAMVGQRNLDEVYRLDVELKTEASFASAFAHEIGPPLDHLGTAIQAIREVGLDSIRDEARRRSITDDVEIAQQCVVEIRDLERTMRHYSRLRQGGGCSVDTIELNQVVSDIVADFREYLRAMRDGNVRIQTELDPDVGRIEADAEQVRTMVSNLLRNADYAVNGNGVIRISTHAVGDTVRILVEDNGPGMTPAVVTRLRRGERHTTKPKGLGLGFLLIHLSCSAHAGRVEIESLLAHGTSITLILPTVFRGQRAAAPAQEGNG